MKRVESVEENVFVPTFHKTDHFFIISFGRNTFERTHSSREMARTNVRKSILPFHYDTVSNFIACKHATQLCFVVEQFAVVSGSWKLDCNMKFI